MGARGPVRKRTASACCSPPAPAGSPGPQPSFLPWLWVGWARGGGGTEPSRWAACPETLAPRVGQGLLPPWRPLPQVPMNPVRGEAGLPEPPVQLPVCPQSSQGNLQPSCWNLLDPALYRHLCTHTHVGPLLPVPVPKRLGIAHGAQGPRGAGRTHLRSRAEAAFTARGLLGKEHANIFLFFTVYKNITL